VRTEELVYLSTCNRQPDTGSHFGHILYYAHRSHLKAYTILHTFNGIFQDNPGKPAPER